MTNRSLAWLLGVALVAGTLGCGPDGGGRRPRSAGDEETKSKNDARMGPLRVVWNHTEEFRACYNEARRTNADLVLKSTIDMAVDEQGRVLWAKVYPMKELPDVKEILAVLSGK